MIVLLLSIGTSLAASSMRCGTNVIKDGDIQAWVADKCGEPAYKNRYQKDIFVSDRLVDDRRVVVRNIIFVDEWTYNFGPRKFLYIVVFENGKVSDIRTEGFGYIE